MPNSYHFDSTEANYITFVVSGFGLFKTFVQKMFIHLSVYRVRLLILPFIGFVRSNTPLPRACCTRGWLRGLVGSALDHISLPPEFESRRGHIWRVFHLWLLSFTERLKIREILYDKTVFCGLDFKLQKILCYPKQNINIAIIEWIYYSLISLSQSKIFVSGWFEINRSNHQFKWAVDFEKVTSHY